MEQTVLRPKPMPGQGRREGGTAGPVRRPHAARRRGRRLRAALLGVFAGTVLVLSGVGIGTVSATVIGMSRLAELQRQAPPPHPSAPVRPSTAAPSPTQTQTTRATLGVEAVDARGVGALVVGVHLPGPGYTAGLVRGDVLLQFGSARIDSAADLARAVAHATPGTEVALTVRHENGNFQKLTAVPGIVT
ncbi:PDZ domain-containing protein [Streptomyces brasiliensis]|uniref:PDZ domain-containing protein n=1 Tax=Streptomyces brasiliensis TaxID=1954 RepID=A0A917KPY5_9ACTN|nr:PDZ domain-containing protein [Streptomyces brasiliensis]GGJ21953.1 PDZ domain-containing protein [Streptomyces brasiliensis]